MDEEKKALLSELRLIRDKLKKQEQLFDLATDGEEIEALIYEGKALSLRYSRLLRRARELGIKGDSF
ncbi:MAG: YaaL family protein [Bacteroides sp.]|nr:YaaL family protein [Eubacterium sp.]MCM1419075.1 YaaL family protein [Roseburia sp.]MCM1462937.1 YaaL family protein [Bacteroides sp.]